jgi:SAM-dependent methyltransferase
VTTTLQLRIDAGYSSPAWWYNVRGFFILLFAYRASLLGQVRFFERNLASPHLEVPVGTGTLLKLVLRLARLRGRETPRVTAVDHSPTMVESARRAFEGSGVRVERSDVSRLGYRDGSFRSVAIANGLHCFPDPERALGEVHRVLAPGGKLAASVLVTPRGSGLRRRLAEAVNAWGQRKGLLVAPLDPGALHAMLVAHGFEIEEETLSGNTVHVVATKR